MCLNFVTVVVLGFVTGQGRGAIVAWKAIWRKSEEHLGDKTKVVR